MARLKKLLKFLFSSGLVLWLCVMAIQSGKQNEKERGAEPCVTGECTKKAQPMPFDRSVQLVVGLPRPTTALQAPIAAKHVNPGIVVYNRVPKCASSTMRWLISRMQKLNHFRYEVHNWPNVKQSLTPKEEKDLVKEISALPRPVVFLRHLHFVDFSKYNVTQPSYINIVRDPVDRFVSHYYFSRYGFVGWSEEKRKKWLYPMPEASRNMSLDECVMADAEKCVTDNRENMLEFFCGQDQRCRNHDDWALEQAKKNVANHYVFIGLLEELDESIKLLEAMLPRYFSGAHTAFKSMSSRKSTRTARKVEPSPKARARLRTALRREIELYDFIKDRLHAQMNLFKDSGKIT